MEVAAQDQRSLLRLTLSNSRTYTIEIKTSVAPINSSICLRPTHASRSPSGRNTKVIVAIVVPIVVLLFSLGGFFLWWRRRRAGKRRRGLDMSEGDAGSEAMAAMLSQSRSNRSIQPFTLAQGSEQPSGPLKGSAARDHHAPSEAGLPPSYLEVFTLSISGGSGPSQPTSSQTSSAR